MDKTLVYERTLELFASQGIKKTTIEEIADSCGVTRMTIYRTCGNKDEIAAAAVSFITTTYSAAITDLCQHRDKSVEEMLKGFSQAFSSLSQYHSRGLLEEMRKLYPQVYAKLQKDMKAAGTRFFSALFDKAETEYSLNIALPRPVIRTYIETVITNLPENQVLQSCGIPAEELSEKLSKALLFGLFTSK